MATYPKDIFDDLPADATRVGAHRGPKRRGAGWITFAWAALATGVLVAGGVVAVSLVGNTSTDLTDTAISTETSDPTAEAVTDPTTIEASRDITIDVVNGTTTAGLAKDALAALDDDKWPVGKASDAKSSEHLTTVVTYGSSDDEDVARGVSQALGVGTVKLDEELTGAPIKVVLGSDYAEAQAAK